MSLAAQVIGSKAARLGVMGYRLQTLMPQCGSAQETHGFRGGDTALRDSALQRLRIVTLPPRATPIGSEASHPSNPTAEAAGYLHAALSGLFMPTALTGYRLSSFRLGYWLWGTELFYEQKRCRPSRGTASDICQLVICYLI